jgi:integrase/recombinase XerD
MSNRRRVIMFQSVLALVIENFIKEKQACGYKYISETDSLRRFDRFLCQEGLRSVELPRTLVQRWTAKTPNESPGNQRERIGLIRGFGDFLIRQGYPAYLPDVRNTPKRELFFNPRILSHEEVQGFFQLPMLFLPTRVPLYGIYYCLRFSVYSIVAVCALAK